MAAAALVWCLTGALPAFAVIPGREAPVPVRDTYNPRPDANDILLPMPCDLEMALRKVVVPGGAAFYIGKYEVSGYQWNAVMTGECGALSAGAGALPLRERPPSEVREFLSRYNAWLAKAFRDASGLFAGGADDAVRARLPGAEEWEFAARGGLAVSDEERGRDIPQDKLREYGVISDPTPIQSPERIGSLKPNPLGLYDTVGNVKEMVAASSDAAIAFKGGSFRHTPGEVRLDGKDEITSRNERGEERRVSDLGFRVAVSGAGYDGALARRAPRTEQDRPAADWDGMARTLVRAFAAVFFLGGVLSGALVRFFLRRRLKKEVGESARLRDELADRQQACDAAEKRAEDAESALARIRQEEANYKTRIVQAAQDKIRAALTAQNEAQEAAEERVEAAEAVLGRVRAETVTALERVRDLTDRRDEAAEAVLGQVRATAETALEQVCSLSSERAATRIRAIKEQLRAALMEVEALRATAEERERAKKAAEGQAELALAQLREAEAELQKASKLSEEHVNRVLEEARQASEQAETALAQARTAQEEAQKARNLAEEQEVMRIHAEEEAATAAAQAEEAAKQAQAAVAELEQVRKIAEERETMRIRAEEEAQKAVNLARAAAEQAKEAAEQARRVRMELEQLLQAARQGQMPGESLQHGIATRFPLEKGGEEFGKADHSSKKPEPPSTYTNSIGVDFVLIPPGSFQMGSPEGEGKDDEHPQHQVTISRDFYLGSYPVTQTQWQAIMGENPSRFNGMWQQGGQNVHEVNGKNHPVESISWNDVQEFIRRLNEKEGHNRYRLPTEAEWEYACRAGTATTYYFGDINEREKIDLNGWNRTNSEVEISWMSRFETHPVGRKAPNVWGLYDMLGNVREWVQDWYESGYYAVSSSLNPQGPDRGMNRVLRGGCYDDEADGCRSASRYWAGVGNRHERHGFRLALDVE